MAISGDTIPSPIVAKGDTSRNDAYSKDLETRVKYYANNPKDYTDLTYKMDPEAYTALPVYLQFMQTYGRSPTANEYAIYSPETVTLGHAGVRAEIAKAFESDPENINKKKNADQLAEAPKHYDEVNSLFQSQLGRTASQDELQHFGSLLASGVTDSYQLQQFLQQQPEYQTKANTNFQNQLSGQLAGYDKQYLQEQVLPAIQANYAKQGRSFDSSAFANSATQSAQQQNIQRQQYLAQLSAQQYGGVQQNAYNDYAAMVQQQNNLATGSIQNSQMVVARANNTADYKLQQDAYNQYLLKYGKRSSGIGSAIGGGIGAIAGAYYGGAVGASAGYKAGSGLGGAAENYFGGSY